MSRGPQRLTEKQRKAIEYYLQGMSKRRALREAGYSDTTPVGSVFNSAAVQAEIQRRLAESDLYTVPRKELSRTVRRALRTLNTLLQDPEPKVRLDAAKLALDKLLPVVRGVGEGLDEKHERPAPAPSKVVNVFQLVKVAESELQRFRQEHERALREAERLLAGRSPRHVQVNTIEAEEAELEPVPKQEQGAKHGQG